MVEENGSLTEAEFVKRAIKKLRELPQKGIHSKYSGFNAAFRQYFDKDPEKSVKRLAEKGKIATRDESDGTMLYLPSEAPAKSPGETLDKIVNSDDGSSSKIDTKEDSPPVVIDKNGSHETTEFALVASENRFWLKNFREDKQRIAVKSVYTAKEDIKSMDRDKTEWQWDGDEKVWAVNADCIDYIINHFLSNGYEVALSPELSGYAMEKMGLSLERVQKEESDRAEERDIEYGVDKETEKDSKIEERDRETEYVESPEPAVNDTEKDGKEETHGEIQKDDIVEHNSGKRGKVTNIKDDTLVVSTGPDEEKEWSEGACEFIRKGR